MCNTNNALAGTNITYQMFRNLSATTNYLSDADTIYKRLLYVQSKFVTQNFTTNLYNISNNMFALPAYNLSSYYCKTIQNNGHRYAGYNSLSDSIADRAAFDRDNGISIPKSHFETAKYMLEVVRKMNASNTYLAKWIREYNRTFSDYKIKIADIENYADHRLYTEEDIEQLNKETNALEHGFLWTVTDMLGLNFTYIKIGLGLTAGYLILKEINKFRNHKQ